ncbi:hypothetical protein F0U44_03365 [Nocardioides humilatus]|uniref:Uncharacterized protein n=1 Tax=Nocardioides humilatus TaxID=2607660 RepID=A0A5B1LLP1_9ACTN|nr:hypothetical protein [Nocardioides humilatus]KAA1421356.1 hypothetical protein F0U44_03365 [Nocardioides humilatus]
MSRSVPAAATALLALALVAPPVATAEAARPAAPRADRAVAPLTNLVVKTVQIGGRKVRFTLSINDRERAFVQMKLRRDGHWRTVASDRTECSYYDGSHDPALEVQKPTKQVLVGWDGPGDDHTDEYGGYSVHDKTIDMFGSEFCTAAG